MQYKWVSYQDIDSDILYLVENESNLVLAKIIKEYGIYTILVENSVVEEYLDLESAKIAIIERLENIEDDTDGTDI